MRYARCASALSLFLWFEPRAGEARSPNALAVRTPRPIALDGRLDESTWKEAPAVSGLTQWEPQRGQPARLDMEVRVLYDDAFVYVGAWLPKPAAVGPVIGHLHRRDQWSASDWFEVNFDTMHDHWNAYQFYVNPANVQMDVLLMGTSSDDAWDAVWESATQVHEGGWSVEARFPLSIFRIQNGPGAQTWGFNFGRQEPLTREIATWVVPPREVTNLVSVFGELDGFDGLKSGTRIELLPYLSPMRRLETSEPWAGRRWAGRAGVDARLGFGASELNLALNPDFGQVEVDQAVLNLSTVETFFQEKRPFFTQGMEVFNNNLGPVFFYSRRIGSALPSPSVGEAERLVERPTARLFGARLQPVQVLRRIERAMEGDRRVVDGHALAPDRFAVRLHPRDLETLGPPTTTAVDLASGALRFARTHGYALRDRPQVSLRADETVPPGDLVIEAAISAAEAPAVAAELGDGGTRRFEVPTVRSPRIALEIREPGRPPRLVPVGAGPVEIGRGRDCEVALVDGRVSRLHATIQPRDGVLILTDLRSTNGTFVNGNRVREIVLGAGDRIGLGDSELMVVADDDDQRG